MALEIKFKVLNLDKVVALAGFTVMDKDRNDFKGFTRIEADGSCVIPVPDGFAQELDKLRVTVDDFTGDNFDETGSSTDWAEVSEVYVDYSVVQDRYYVTCIRQVGVTYDWDMGDGTIVTSANHKHLYEKNGTYTITNGTFEQEVIITDVVEFSVVLEGNKVICTGQTGYESSTWNFSEGGTSKENNTEYYFYENGTYIVSYGIFSETIVVDYYTNGLLESVNGNFVTFRLPENGATVFDYGDYSSDTELTHWYAQGGTYLVKIGNDHRFFVEVEHQQMPTIGTPQVVAAYPDSTQLNFRLLNVTEGVTYDWLIDGIAYTTEIVDYAVPFSDDDVLVKYIAWSCRITDEFGNSAFYSNPALKVEQPNIKPKGDIYVIKESRVLKCQAINIVDVDGDPSLVTVKWDMGDGYAGSYLVGDSVSKTIEYQYFPTEEEYQDITITLTLIDRRLGQTTVTKDVRVYNTELLGDNLIVNGDLVTNDLSAFEPSSATLTWNEGVMTILSTSGSSGRAKVPLVAEEDKQYKVTIEYNVETSSTQSIKNFNGFDNSPAISLNSLSKETRYEYIIATGAEAWFSIYAGYSGVSVLVHSLKVQEVI